MKSPRISVVVIIVIMGLILPLLLATGGAEYTTPLVWSNKKQYDPSETAYLYGYGFKPSAQVTITIARPDLVEDTILTSTDEFGYFSCQYLLDGIHGNYAVTATDGVNVATTTFENSLGLSAWWDSHDSIYIYAQAEGLSTSKQYYIKYLDPALVERRQSPTYTGVKSFTDKLTILPTFPNVFDWWNVTLYENGALKRTKQVYIDRIVWTTDSTYITFDTSFAQGEIVYFKTMGLKTTKYYRFKLQMPNGTMFYVNSWTNGVTQMTGSYPLPSNAPLGTWKLHVRQASDASGTCEDHYVDCCFEVTTPPPPQQYYLTVRTEPTGIGTIPEEGWYNACTLVNLTAPEFFPRPSGTRYRFNYWDVDGVPNATGIYEITVHMNANHTATAHYITQYFLNLTTNPPGVTTPAGVDWYDAGTNAPIFAPEFVGIELGASRYRFINWTTGDMSEIDDPSAISTTVFMDKAKTVTANYVIQYYLTVISPYGMSGGEGWYASGSAAYATLDTDIVDYGNGTRRVFLYWSDDAYGTNYAQSDPILMNGPKTAIAQWKTQYRLDMSTNFGSISPSVGPHWYDEDSVVSISATAPSVIDGERYIWLGWTGTGTISYTGMDNLASITMNSPITQTASWEHQFLLTIKTSGLPSAYPTNVYLGGLQVSTASDASSYTKWFDAGTPTGTIGVDNTFSGAAGTRYVFVKWVEDSSTNNPRSSENMNSPKTFTAEYKTQYQITVTASPSGALGGTFKVTYTQCGTTYTNVQRTTSWTEWADAGTSVSVSEPQDIVNGYKFDHYDPSQSVTMTAAKTITLAYSQISGLSVSINPTTAKIKVGESVVFTSTVSGGLSPYSYQWYLNRSAVPGATSSTWTFTPTATGYYIVYLNVTDGTPQTVKSNEASVTVAPPLTVSISPTSASILVGQSVVFTSTVSGGYPPYSYQWYLNDAPVSGATSSSWTFTPTTSGIYYVYLKVIDANNNVVQSETARISVAAVPVGGYSISLVKQTPAFHIAAYSMLIALFAVAISLTKRKRK